MNWNCTLLLTLTIVLPASAWAGAEAEREALARLAHELQALEPLIQDAETRADRDARIRFQYSWLRQDLRRVREGIEDHLRNPSAEPRRFPPLRGDYQR